MSQNFSCHVPSLPLISGDKLLVSPTIISLYIYIHSISATTQYQGFKYISSISLTKTRISSILRSKKKMRTKVNDDPTSASAFSKNFKSTSPVPQRGQIKIKIAAKALQSLVSIVSPSSSPRYSDSPRKKSQLKL
ncbi:hypothetical protein ABFS83_05G109300 [Erythranthe nasuta]